tara:strand:+ start:170 stop:544 length:375 start_codon:yes stop_codon:yes gene_type:complete
MRAIKIILLLFLFPVLGCEKNENIEEYIFKTWDLDWKQCGVYQNKYDTKINFSETDSIHYGWVLEQGKDSVKFNMEILNTNSILLSETTDSTWGGVLKIKDLNMGLLVFEKEVKECSNEIYRFK